MFFYFWKILLVTMENTIIMITRRAMVITFLGPNNFEALLAEKNHLLLKFRKFSLNIHDPWW